MNKKLRNLLLLLSTLLLLGGCIRTPDPGNPGIIISSPQATAPAAVSPSPDVTAVAQNTAAPLPSASALAEVIPKETTCDDKACVALYIHTYGELPSNYMTKKQARKIGWESGPLWKKAEGMCIGGDKFSDYSDHLPDQYQFYECDINTLGKKKRGAERIVYTEDGSLIYYTPDHYESYELLYGEE